MESGLQLTAKHKLKSKVALEQTGNRKVVKRAWVASFTLVYNRKVEFTWKGVLTLY